MIEYPFIKYKSKNLSIDEIEQLANDFYIQFNQRRSVRDISDKWVPKQVIEKLLLSSNTAPSGANKQPWTFCAVSSKALKKEIRIAAEEEEKENYAGRMSDEWIRDLAHLGTDEHKPFLESAPWLIVVFKKSYNILPDGTKTKNYYVNESVGLACGFLLAAIHNAGLVSLTHTPSPMNFLTKLLNRPINEKPYLLIPVGYAAENAEVPDIKRKKLDEFSVWYE